MNIFKILGLLFFSTAILSTLVFVIYNWILIYKINKNENIKMADLILAQKKPADKWKNKLNRVKPLKSVSLILFIFSIFLFIIGFIIK